MAKGIRKKYHSAPVLSYVIKTRHIARIAMKKTSKYIGRCAIATFFESCKYLKIVHKKSVEKTAMGSNTSKEEYFENSKEKSSTISNIND
jgi:hypothetical protein